ncbi:hypothetical protein Pfo_006633 [Paulownia fortunei]|nr:hypothetical protein Pfo_006633 [Paulownia fortunei]
MDELPHRVPTYGNVSLYHAFLVMLCSPPIDCDMKLHQLQGRTSLIDTIVRQGDKILRSFLWKLKGPREGAKVAWDKVCCPKIEGRGLKNIAKWNKGVMIEHIWNILSLDWESIWRKWVKSNFLKDGSFGDVKHPTVSVHGHGIICNNSEEEVRFFKNKVGDGNNTFMHIVVDFKNS